MRQYMKVEFKHLVSNKKNWVIWIVLFLLGIYYAQVDVAKFLPTEHVDERVLSAEYDEKKEFLNRVVLNENSHYSTVYYYHIYPKWKELVEKRLEAISENDYQSYAKYSSLYYEYADVVIRESPVPDLYYNLEYYKNRNAYAKQDGHYGYRKTAQLYSKYAELDFQINKNVINEKTAIQSLYRASIFIIPIILMLSVLFINVDSYFSDQQHSSITKHYPLTPFKKVITKILIGNFSGVLCLAMFIPGFILIGINYGFGSLKYPVSIFENDFINQGKFISITLANYFSIYLLLLWLWLLVIGIAILVVNHALKRLPLSLLMVSFFLSIDYLFARRGIGVRSIFLYLPTSYIKIGEVITGHRSYFYGNQWLNDTSGLIVLSLCFLLLFMSLFIILRIKKE